MTRGRGFSSRGSGYRGSSRGGSSWGGGRGYGSRGSGGHHFSSSFSNSYDSRSKYPGSNERYSRGHGDDYRKSYRSESGYGGRDSSGHRSPERKRMRTEALSSRHDSGGYGGGGDSFNSSRYESSNYTARRSFSSDRRASFSRREEFRKPSGPPPSSSPRGGYRGRLSSRGSRGRLRDRPIRRRLVDTSYAVRRRAIQTARSSDYARRLKLARLRSAAVRRATIKKSKINGKDSDDDDEKNEDWEDADEEKQEEDEEEKKKEGEADGESEEKVNDEAKPEGEEGDEGAEKKSPKKEKDDKADKEDKKSETGSSYRKSRYIKLQCLHCGTKSVTFNKYSMHLLSSRHGAAMRRIAMKQKSILSQMRMTQRHAQRELEKTTDDLAPRTNFCPLCKLNYKQPKSTHQNSELHKNMKKFLMPYCKTCKITFKSPMLYENHLCSIDHIKRKARSEVNGEKSDREDSANDEDNLENFMTIDSVGDVDEEEGEGRKKEPEIKKEHINVGIEQIRKVEVHYCDLCRMYLPRVEDNDLPRVLSKHCKQRTHMQHYIRYKEDKDLAKRAERLQRKENAEKENREKKEKVEPASEAEETPAKKEKAEGEEKVPSADDEDAEDNKLWADVDKDLGDILAGEAEGGNKSSDEDDDSHANGERYDRFKYSEKGDDEKLKKVNSTGGEEGEAEVKENSVVEEAEVVEGEKEK